MKKKNLLMTALTILILMTSTMAQVPNYVPTSGLAAWYSFTGNANDDSGNGYNAITNGAVLTADRNGVTNSAYNLQNLNDNISVSTLSSPYSGNSLTISFWMQFPQQYNYSSIYMVKNGVAWSNGFSISVDQNDGAYGANNYQVTFIVGSTPCSFITNQSELGIWSNIVAVYNGSDMKLYLNNVLKTTVTYSSNISSPDGNLVFSDWDNPTTPVVTNRNIDDIGIWNRALTQQEVTTLYNGCQLSVNTQPTNQTININNNAQFIVSSSDPNATFQWQTDLGVGFQNLNSVGQYSGTTKDTLTVSYVTMSNNNQPFRCIVNAGSCSDTSNAALLTVSNNVGINEFTKDNLFSVFPNPANSIINVKADIKLIGEVYSIHDNTGRIVLTGKVNAQNTTIELGNLSGGIYMCKVGDNMKQTFKIIMQ